MKYQDGMYVPSDAEQAEMDAAAWSLGHIERVKEDLASLKDTVERLSKNKTLSVTRAQVQECFVRMEEELDELLYPDWERLSAIECAMGRSSTVPSFLVEAEQGMSKGAL